MQTSRHDWWHVQNATWSAHSDKHVYAEIPRLRKESESPGYFAKNTPLNLYRHCLDQFRSKFLVMGLQ